MLLVVAALAPIVVLVALGAPRMDVSVLAETIPLGQVPCATGGGNKDDSACHCEASVAVWRSHCEAGLGVMAPIPYHKICCFRLHVDDKHSVPSAPVRVRGYLDPAGHGEFVSKMFFEKELRANDFTISNESSTGPSAAHVAEGKTS